MQNHLLKVLVTDFTIIILLIGLMFFSVSKKAWAGVFFSAFGLIGFSYGSLRSFSLLYTDCDIVIGKTTGYSSPLKSGGSIKYHFLYNGTLYKESSSAYKNLNNIMTKGGTYKVHVCRNYPKFNEIDFDSPLLDDDVILE